MAGVGYPGIPGAKADEIPTRSADQDQAEAPKVNPNTEAGCFWGGFLHWPGMSGLVAIGVLSMRGFLQKRYRYFGFLIPFLASLSGAGAETAVTKLYVLSRQLGIHQNAVSEIKLPEGKTERSVRVIPSNAMNLSRDPFGRLWVTLTQNAWRNDNRVQVFFAELQPLKTITTHNNPEAGVSFSRDRAYVACAENGFGGVVDVLDLNTLSLVKTVQIHAQAKASPYLLTSMASSDRKIVLAGMTSGPDQGRRYGIITVVNPASLAVTWQSSPMEDLDVWTILPYGDAFLLLNVASADKGGGNTADLLVLKPDNRIESVSVAPSPLWGTIVHDTLYMFHNPTWNSTSPSPQRMLSSYSLKNKTVTRWPLPDNWDAGGICIIANRILLTSRAFSDTSQQGVYEYDPVQQKLFLLANIPGADKSVTGE